MASDEYVAKVAKTIVEQIEHGVSAWQKPWGAGGERFMPYNPVTGKNYRGGNAVWLHARQQELGTSDSRWLTYQQAAKEGGQVRKGQKATPIMVLTSGGYEPAFDAAGGPKLDASGRQLREWVEYERPRVFSANVFNAAQIDGLPVADSVRGAAWQRHQVAASILENSGAAIVHQSGDWPRYDAAGDTLVLPPAPEVASLDAYYARALHELGHWTGRPGRLDREQFHPLGSAGHAREELRVGMASLMVGDQLGLGYDPLPHAAYLPLWVEAIKDDPRELFRAARDADAISRTLLGYGQALELDQVQSPAPYRALTGSDATRWFVTQVGKLHDRAESREDVYRGMRRIGPEPAPGEPIYVNDAGDRVYPDLVQPAPAAATVVVRPDVARGLGAEFVDHEGQAVLPSGVKALRGEERFSWYESQLQWLGEAEQEGQDVEWGSAALGPMPQDGEVIYIEERRGWRVYPTGQSSRATRSSPMANTPNPAIQIESQPVGNASLQIGADVNIAYAVDTATAKGVRHVSGVIVGARPTATGNTRYDVRPAGASVPVVVYSNQIMEVAPAGQALTEPASLEIRGPDVASAYAAEDAQPRQFLSVPFAERDDAYKLGARRDKEAKVWYVPDGVDPAPLQRWAAKAQTSTLAEIHEAARSEFAQALREFGFQLDGEPVMDGKFHRIKLVGDKGATKNGTYAGHLDNRPGGTMKNHRTGEQANWAASRKMDALSAADRARLNAEAAARRVQRERAQASLYESRAEVAERLWNAAAPAGNDHPYAVRKAVSVEGLRLVPDPDTDLGPNANVLIGATYADSKRIRQELERTGKAEGVAVLTQGDLLVDLRDDAGKLWSLQTIGNTGRKSYLTDARKVGTMHLVGNAGQLQDKRTPIIVAEGYATARTLSSSSQSGETPVFVALDAGNLGAVARALSEKYPGQLLIIGGDNDHMTAREIDERTGKAKINRGVVDATAAAKEVGGIAVFPQFKESDPGSDWNDLARSEGLDAVREQFRGGAVAAIAHHKAVLADMQRKQEAQQLAQQHAVQAEPALARTNQMRTGGRKR